MIRNIILLSTITLCVCVSTALSADTHSDTVSIADNNINGKTADTAAVDDTTDIAKADSIGKARIDVIDLDDEELLQAALSADSVKAPSAQKLDLIRREHEYKKQTRAAIVMMIFIALAMATSQSWNPK